MTAMKVNEVSLDGEVFAKYFTQKQGFLGTNWVQICCQPIKYHAAMGIRKEIR